jgi:hypothetical protein
MKCTRKQHDFKFFKTKLTLFLNKPEILAFTVQFCRLISEFRLIGPCTLFVNTLF